MVRKQTSRRHKVCAYANDSVFKRVFRTIWRIFYFNQSQSYGQLITFICWMAIQNFSYMKFSISLWPKCDADKKKRASNKLGNIISQIEITPKNICY